MNIRYIEMPIDYITKLKQSGQPEKARAFMEYFYDLQICLLEDREPNSIHYYATSWGEWYRGKPKKKKSLSMTSKWVNEFRIQIDKFNTSWSLINDLNEARINHKNRTGQKIKEHSKNSERIEKTSLNTNIMGIKKNERIVKEQRKKQEYNIYDDDSDVQKIEEEYKRLFFIYRIFNGSYTGSKSDGLEAYKLLENRPKYKEMEKAIKLYFADKRVIKKCGIANFFKNNIYMDYTTKKVSIFIDGSWIDGSYLASEEKFITSYGEEMILSIEGFSNFFANDRVKLLDFKEVA